MERLAPRKRAYWQAEGLVTKGWARFEAARAANSPARQRSAFFQLAKYQAKTIQILQTAFGGQNEALAQATLLNLLALHRGLMQMYRTAPDLVPVPLLMDEDAREDFVSDLIVQVLSESNVPLSMEDILSRTRHFDILGELKQIEKAQSEMETSQFAPWDKTEVLEQDRELFAASLGTVDGIHSLSNRVVASIEELHELTY